MCSQSSIARLEESQIQELNANKQPPPVIPAPAKADAALSDAAARGDELDPEERKEKVAASQARAKDRIAKKKAGGHDAAKRDQRHKLREAANL